MLFLLLLALSGSTLGMASEILYYLAFIVPVGLALNHAYGEPRSPHDSGVNTKEAMLQDLGRDFSLTKKGSLDLSSDILPCGKRDPFNIRAHLFSSRSSRI